jgi:hypothetical protein
VIYQKCFISRYILFRGYILALTVSDEKQFLASEVVSRQTLWDEKPDGLHISGGSNPNAYMPRLQILHGY